MLKTAWLNLFLLIATNVSSQLTPLFLQMYISNDVNLDKIEIKHKIEIRKIYEKLNYKTAWIKHENLANQWAIIRILSEVHNVGLYEKDYQYAFFKIFQKDTHFLNTLQDSVQAEILFTDAAIHFCIDVTNGNTSPNLGYAGLKEAHNYDRIMDQLVDCILQKSVPQLYHKVSPTLPIITLIETKLQLLLQKIDYSGFEEVFISSSKVNSENKELLIKLYQLDLLDSAKEYHDSIIKIGIKKAQQLFNLLADGKLRTSIIDELNISVKARVKQLILALNYYRWLYTISQNEPIIVVNIPSTYLKVYENNMVAKEMKIIVGKKSTPTPTLSSNITEVILYPYWHVPYSIATKELLPLIKKNAQFIDDGNYQVLDKNGRIVDPYRINWKKLSSRNFPYIIRQSTGCDNALGLLKLNFYNPYSVYLHDTPNKKLFMLSKRFFSHGCMRLEEPMQLGRYILKDNTIAIDTLEQKGCLRNQKPITVPAKGNIPVVVWYNPVDVDVKGCLTIYEDIYDKFNWLKQK
jgi:L,D-transpeptidase YcbB